MRTKSPSARAFEKAYDRGYILRLHLLRGTWQLIAARDYGWLSQLCFPKAAAITQGWMRSNGVNIPAGEISSVQSIIERTVAEKISASKQDIANALSENGHPMDAHRLSYHIRMAEFSGLICSGNLHPKMATYSLVSQKIGAVPRYHYEEALIMLARKYFQSRSPSTLEDFVWWSGLNIGECRRGIDALGTELYCESFNGKIFYIHESCRTKGLRRGCVHLLPSYDEYLIAYKSREPALPPEYKYRAHNNNGIFRPVIACDGVICGNWAPFARQPEFDFFSAPVADERLQKAWNEYRKFGE